MIPEEQKYVIIRKAVGAPENAIRGKLKDYINLLKKEGYAIYDYRKHIIVDD